MGEQMPELIKGGSHSDRRGAIRFVNDFDMSRVKRFYIIENSNTHLRRGWRGHKIEQRWFSVLEGSFIIQLVKIDNWEKPDISTHILECLMTSEQFSVLHIPAGYASCIRANVKGAKLMVFADHDIEHAKLDDYLYPEDYFELINRGPVDINKNL